MHASSRGEEQSISSAAFYGERSSLHTASMRAEPVSLSFEAIASVREVLRTVDEELLAFEAPQLTDASQQSRDDIVGVYDTLLAHGFEVTDIEKALQVQQTHCKWSAAACTACWGAAPAIRNPAVLLIVDFWTHYTTNPRGLVFNERRRRRVAAGTCRRATRSTGSASISSRPSCPSSSRRERTAPAVPASRSSPGQTPTRCCLPGAPVTFSASCRAVDPIWPHT